ncbi:MAG: twin-arginine translocation signal domain-containing protein, partial [Candidatus Rokubacteria bacterium]|nr:twin-arginine translocation signal domain-containing protein [Candidatus Rokubacteria bacterium]
MSLTRRDFLKGAGTGAALGGAVGVELGSAEAYVTELKTKG